MSGSILGFASPMEEGRLQNGIPYGAMSGSSYASISPVLARKFVLPFFGVFHQGSGCQISGLLSAALSTRNLTGIATANPSSILKLVHLIEDNIDQLMTLLRGEHSSWVLPAAEACLPEILQRGDHRHIAELNKKLHLNGSLTPADIWPKLSTIATWTVAAVA